jgi:hypothetical protein
MKTISKGDLNRWQSGLLSGGKWLLCAMLAQGCMELANQIPSWHIPEVMVLPLGTFFKGLASVLFHASEEAKPS